MNTEKLKQLLDKKIAHDATMMCAPYLRSMISRTVSEEYCINIGNSLAEHVLKLAEALKFYAEIGNDNNPKLDECLERAMQDRVTDKTTINLGGKYIAKTAREALNELYKDLGGLE